MAELEELLCGKLTSEAAYGRDSLRKFVRDTERLALFVETQNLDVEPEPAAVPGQMQKIRSDQVENYAGGFVFKVSDETRVRRFLMLGTTGGTYYCTEKELTLDNVKALYEIIQKGKGLMMLREIIDISISGRAPIQNPTLFALALCARFQVRDTTRKNFLRVAMKKFTGGEISAEERRIAMEQAMVLATEFEAKEQSLKIVGSEFDQQAPFFAYLDYQRGLQRLAFWSVEKVCRIPTHLFAFVKYCKQISSLTGTKEKSSGWGRAMRSAITRWYSNQDPEKLAMHVTKYQQREGYSHRDLFRLCHICPSTSFDGSKYWKSHEVYDFIFKYIVEGEANERKRKAEERAAKEAAKKKAKLADGAEKMDTKAKSDGEAAARVVEEREKRRKEMNEAREKEYLKRETAHSGKLEASKAVQLINAFEAAKKLTDGNALADLIRKAGLVREHIPSEMLNSKEVWAALLEHMPMTAMIRNLGKMASVGLLTGGPDNREHVARVIEKLTNEDALHAARIHPISVLLAASVYKNGRGFRGSNTWTPIAEVADALEKAFILSFKNVTPTNKRYCLALDVSGSMGAKILNSFLSCRDAAAALSMAILRTEPKVETVAFSKGITELPFDAASTLESMNAAILNMQFSSTDCALPMIWALENKKEFDVFVIYTDNETWFGDIHPFVALKNYREKMNIPDARVAVMGMTATDFSIADPSDAGMLDIVGFDSAVPDLLKEFVLGNI